MIRWGTARGSKKGGYSAAVPVAILVWSGIAAAGTLVVAPGRMVRGCAAVPGGERGLAVSLGTGAGAACSLGGQFGLAASMGVVRGCVFIPGGQRGQVSP